MRAFISSRSLLCRSTLPLSRSITKQAPRLSIGSVRSTHHHGLSPHNSRPLRDWNINRKQFHSSPSILHQEDTTIYALSTATGRAAIAVIRISGPACKQVASSPPHYLSSRLINQSTDRYTRVSAPPSRSLNPAMPLSGNYILLTFPLRHPPSSSLAPSSSTFQRRTL